MLLYDCVKNLINNQFDSKYHNTICIVDSDSSDFSQYDRVKAAYPDVEVHLAKNRNYEYGAWKYALATHPDYDIYFCIQDSLIVHGKIDLSSVNDQTALTFYHNSGYWSMHADGHAPQEGIEHMKDSGLAYEELIKTRFTLATHSSFIVSRNVLIDIFNTLTKPAMNKEDSVCYERSFGLYFILKNIRTIDIQGKIQKIHGGRI
jgi:hypothetical protein